MFEKELTMNSTSMFKDCPTCSKQIAKISSACPSCGHKFTKLWVKIVVSIIALFVLGAILGSNEEKGTTNISGTQTEPRPSQINKTTEMATIAESKIAKESSSIKVPDDQARFIGIVRVSQGKVGSTRNDLQRAQLRDERASELRKNFTEVRVKDWTGSIVDITTNSEGLGVLSIRIADNILVKTWNNAISDIGSETLIPKESKLYKELLHLNIGDQVLFSGTFLQSDRDHFQESSVTTIGMLESPEYIFRFQTVKKLN